MLDDAELLLGLTRHLRAFQRGSATVRMEDLAFAGSIYELAWALRNSAVSTVPRVTAIGTEAGIGRRELANHVLPAMEQLGWIELRRDKEGVLCEVSETIPPPDVLVQLSPTVLALSLPSEAELAALEVLRSTSRQPGERSLVVDEVVAAKHSEVAVVEAISILSAVGLVQVETAADGRTVVFNPNVWVNSTQAVEAALKGADAKVHQEVGGLIEEIARYQGMPEVHVKATEQRWIDFAVTFGLVDRSVVQTDDGVEQRFLFTPHLHHDPFTGALRDPSGHARQLVGSMVYAATFADYKLKSPPAFVRALIRDGEAGDASPIGSDYPMLETAGIIRVVPGSTDSKFRLQLLQTDVAEEALRILSDTAGWGNSTTKTPRLLGQNSYTHIEKERARLATEVETDSDHRAALIAALRETARGNIRGR